LITTFKVVISLGGARRLRLARLATTSARPELVAWMRGGFRASRKASRFARQATTAPRYFSTDWREAYGLGAASARSGARRLRLARLATLSRRGGAALLAYGLPT